MDQLEFVSIPVGHGDATLVVWTPAGGQPWSMLVDGGQAAADRVEQVTALLETRGIEQLDLVVLSHVDADHVDGLVTLANAGIRPHEYWGPCLPAFERHAWLFPPRIRRGLGQARELERIWAAAGTRCIHPLEGYVLRRPDQGLRVSVLSPPARLIERLLIGDDALDLFARVPTPLAWLFDEPDPIDDEDLGAARFGPLFAGGATMIDPTEIDALGPPAPLGGGEVVAEKVEEWSAEFGLGPEFFGNNVLNDTSIVLSVDAMLTDASQETSHTRRALLTGDQENWTWLLWRYGRALACDLLKAPHHGGAIYLERTISYDEFMQTVRPDAVLVSATGAHKLPRAEFREAVTRWGATLFCPCVRRSEVITGLTPTGASCRVQHDCDNKAKRQTTVTLTAKGMRADTPACATGFEHGAVRVIRVAQHVIEPSALLDRFTEGELRRHIDWCVDQLEALHKARGKASGTGPPIDVEVLRSRARAAGRHGLADQIEVVIARGRRRGELWATKPERYNRSSGAVYLRPPKRVADQQWEVLRERVMTVLRVPASVAGLSPEELLLQAHKQALLEHAAGACGYPIPVLDELVWPELAARAATELHGFVSNPTGYDRHRLCVVSSAPDTTALHAKFATLGDIIEEYEQVRRRPSSSSRTGAEAISTFLRGHADRAWLLGPDGSSLLSEYVLCTIGGSDSFRLHPEIRQLW